MNTDLRDRLRGELPGEWDVLPLKRTCSLVADYGVNLPASEYGTGAVRFLRTTDLRDDGGLIPDEEGVFVDRALVRDKILASGDLLVSRSGTVGLSYLARENDGEMGFAGYLVRFRPRPEFDPRFFFYFTKSQLFDDQIAADSTSTTIENFSGQRYANMLMPLPLAKEQRAIADFLDTKTGKIDEVIGGKRQTMGLLAERRLSAISTAVRGAPHESPPRQSAGGSGDSAIPWHGELPHGWKSIRLRRLFRAVNGGTPASGEPDYWGGDVPWVTPADLGELERAEIAHGRRFLSEEGYENCGATLVPPGALVLSTRAPIGHVAIATRSLCTNQGCRSLIPSADISSRYFYYVLIACRDVLQHLGQGATFTELSTDAVESLRVPCPPLSEQVRIAQYLDEISAASSQSASFLGHGITRLREYRSSVISAAVMGKLNTKIPAGAA